MFCHLWPLACATPSTITPEGYDGTTETFTVNMGVVLLTLDSSLDYEVKTSYSVVMETVDTGKTPPTTGTITVKVRSSYCVAVFFKKVIKKNLIENANFSDVQ